MNRQRMTWAQPCMAVLLKQACMFSYKLAANHSRFEVTVSMHCMRIIRHMMHACKQLACSHSRALLPPVHAAKCQQPSMAAMHSGMAAPRLMASCSASYSLLYLRSSDAAW